MFKALKTKVDNFSMVGAFVLANNKENLNVDGCLWYFGGISSFLKAVYFGHTNKKCTSVSGVLQNGQFISCLLYTSPSPRDYTRSRMPSSA